MVAALDEQISKLKERLGALYATIDILYAATKKNEIIRGSNLEKMILSTEKTSFSPKSAEAMIWDFYASDSEEFTPEEFPLVYGGIALGLLDYYSYRLRELQNLEITLAEPLLAQTIADYLPELYPHPNDFLFEYNEFKEWHENSSDPVKSNSFTTWMDAIIGYCVISTIYHNVFEQEANDLKGLKTLGLSFLELRGEQQRIETELQ